MRITTASPVRSMDGTYLNSDLVFFTRGGRTFARARVVPANPRSQDQVLVRTYMALAAANWDMLTPEQREAWQQYAKTYFTLNDRGERVEPSGIATYTRANTIRQILGLPLVAAAPTQAPPAPITSLTQEPASSDSEMAFVINHGHSSVAGLQILVRATPAMPSVARRPRPGDFRYIRGVSPLSAVALPASGSTVTFGPVRFPVADGQRYGVEVRVVRTADGLMSRPVTGDFIRLVP